MGIFSPLLDLRCNPALFLANETYSGAWNEKLGVRQGETAAGKQSCPWERSGIRLNEPNPAREAPADTRSSPEGRVIHRWPPSLATLGMEREWAGAEHSPASSL